ncbi:hypothetical protein LA03_10240 [Burkholderia gladioli]|nr:hypothetical protein LA03_10240 [Burkholderia gladioli]
MSLEQLRHRPRRAPALAWKAGLCGFGTHIVARAHVRNQRTKTLDTTVSMRRGTAGQQLIQLRAPDTGCAFDEREALTFHILADRLFAPQE